LGINQGLKPAGLRAVERKQDDRHLNDPMAGRREETGRLDIEGCEPERIQLRSAQLASFRTWHWTTGTSPHSLTNGRSIRKRATPNVR